jgi:hypothetical protein
VLNQSGLRRFFSITDGHKRGRAATILEEVQTAVKRWPEFTAAARVPDEWRDKIQKTHRLTFPKA